MKQLLKALCLLMLPWSAFATGNTANIPEICFGQFTYSEKFAFKESCEINRLIDVSRGKSISLYCSEGIFFYYYCVLKE
ncbi:hypothetical protein [Legionella londiniensis]|nr:hypothetical protein [Legionella londiniensis]